MHAPPLGIDPPTNPTTSANAMPEPGASPRPPALEHWGYPPYAAPPYRQGPFYGPARSQSAARPAPLRLKELGAALGVALASDLALWSGARNELKAGGFGLAFLFVVAPITLFVAARVWRGSIRLAVVASLLAAVAARCAFDPTPAVVLVGLGLVVVLTLTLRARRTFLPEVALSMLAAASALPSRLSAALAGVRRTTARPKMGEVSLLPVVVPAGLVLVFAGVFALANPVVAHAFGVAWAGVSTILSPSSLLRLALWWVAVVAGISLLRPAIRLARGTEAAGDVGDATSTTLHVARNALGALNVLFLLYNMLDAAYLWVGAPPAGMHTQQYAHQGAFWLTVALVMVTGVVGIMFKGPLAHDARAKLSRTLAYIWMAQGIVLTLGTYRRIGIHIGNSGLSDLRIVGILGTTLVACGVAAVAVKLHRRRTFTWLVRRQLDAFAIALVVYVLFPTHLVSARVNVARIDKGEYRPLLHMFRQSTKPESAATLLPLLHHSDVRVRQGVAALLERERERLRGDVGQQGSWRERDIASERAVTALDHAAPQIASVLGSVDRDAARHVLLEISRVANEGRSLEELLAVPGAESWSRDGSENYVQ